eukprot:TRINITY_DN9233_c0_g1_i1.p1 TRINITY_DN9233_c0_g1~~TRINITY_DN9233_c0_g1_i1.p1  ORF type:complete len:317 (+),score=47.15 TRINITY_DN9233_c0_g1_i1:35-952(+)
MEGRPIALCEHNSQGKLDLTRTIDPSGNLDSQNPLYLLALTDDNGQPHYAPAKQAADGLLTRLPQTDGESGGFMDALLRTKGGPGGADDVGVYAQRLKGFAQGLSLEPPEALVKKAVAALPESQSGKPCGLDSRLMIGASKLVAGAYRGAANTAATCVKESWQYCKENPLDATLLALDILSAAIPVFRTGLYIFRAYRSLVLWRMAGGVNRQVIMHYGKKQAMDLLSSSLKEAAVDAAFGETAGKVYRGASTGIGTYKGLKIGPLEAGLDAAVGYSLKPVKARTTELVAGALRGGDAPIRNRNRD